MIVLNGGVRYRLERVLFSPDGADVLAPLYSGVQVWRSFVTAGAPELLPVKYVTELQFVPGTSTLLAFNAAVNSIDYATGAAINLLDQRFHVPRFALAHAGDRYLAGDGIWSEPFASLRTLAGTALWERRGQSWWQHPRFLPGDTEFVALVVEGQARREQKFRFVAHDTATGDELHRSNPLAGEVRDWVISPDGALAACWTTVWVHVYPLRVTFDKPLATVRNNNRKEFTGLAFHPSGKYLATTSNDATVKLYDTATWEVARTFTWNIGRMRSIAFSPDGALAAAGSDTGKVVVWDVDL